MSKIQRLGEQFSPEKHVFIAKKPKAFDKSLAEKLEYEAAELLKQEQKLNSSRNYRVLLTKLINKEIDSKTELMLDAFEQQFGKTLVQEAVEYMTTVNTSWELKAFSAYLIKVLQGNHKQYVDQFADKTLEDSGIEQLDDMVNRSTRKQIMEIKQWERSRNR